MAGLIHDHPCPGQVDQPRLQYLPHLRIVGDESEGEVQPTFCGPTGQMQCRLNLGSSSFMNLVHWQPRLERHGLGVEHSHHVRHQFGVDVRSESGPGLQ